MVNFFSAFLPVDHYVKTTFGNKKRPSLAPIEPLGFCDSKTTKSDNFIKQDLIEKGIISEPELIDFILGYKKLVKTNVMRETNFLNVMEGLGIQIGDNGDIILDENKITQISEADVQKLSTIKSLKYLSLRNCLLSL